MTLRKQWFIKSKTGNIEDVYEIDNKKVRCLRSLAAGHRSFRHSSERQG